MNDSFPSMLAVDGKKNSLGLVNDVIALVLDDSLRLEELYQTIKDEDAWVRMRAIDAFEKICREHPEWIQPYIDKIQKELGDSTQPSIQWHIAQIYDQVELTSQQKTNAIHWLKARLKTTETDWIVAANCMKTLASFTKRGEASKADLLTALAIQQHHKSNAVVKRAKKLLLEFS